MDEIQYEYRDGKNILTLRKKRIGPVKPFSGSYGENRKREGAFSRESAAVK